VLLALQKLTAGPNSDPLRDGFQATTLDRDEVVRLLDETGRTRRLKLCTYGMKLGAGNSVFAKKMCLTALL